MSTEATKTNRINYESMISDFINFEPDFNSPSDGTALGYLSNRTLSIYAPRQTGKSYGLVEAITSEMEKEPDKVFGFFSRDAQHLLILEDRIKTNLEGKGLELDDSHVLFKVHNNPVGQKEHLKNVSGLLEKLQSVAADKGKPTGFALLDYVVLDPSEGINVMDFIKYFCDLDVVYGKTKFIFVN